MDPIASTIRSELDTPEALAAATRRLADRAAIHDLAALYAMAADDGEVDKLVAMFASDGGFEHNGTEYLGHDALRDFYVIGANRYSLTVHVPEAHVVWFPAEDQGEGVASGHGELVFNGRLMSTAFRYRDIYRRIDERWLFQRRSLSTVYLAPLDELGSSFHDDKLIRWPGRTPVAPGERPRAFPS
jgi:hypothetical protein